MRLLDVEDLKKDYERNFYTNCGMEYVFQACSDSNESEEKLVRKEAGKGNSKY